MARAIPGDASDRLGLAFQTTANGSILAQTSPRAPHLANNANQADNHQPKTSLPSGLVWQQRHQMVSLYPEWQGRERLNPLRASARGHNFCEGAAGERAHPMRRRAGGGVAVGLEVVRERPEPRARRLVGRIRSANRYAHVDRVRYRIDCLRDARR
jgi:hypothetical protein